MTYQGIVEAVAFSPDGKTVLTGNADQTARCGTRRRARPSVSR